MSSKTFSKALTGQNLDATDDDDTSHASRQISGRVQGLIDSVIAFEGRLTILHYAVQKDDLEMIKWSIKHLVDIEVIENGPNIEGMDTSGKRVLYCRTRPRNLETFTYMMKHSADIKAEDRDGRTVLHYAARKGNSSIVKWLIEYGANVEAKDKVGKTILFDAVMSGNLEMCGLLIEHGANVKAKDTSGRTILFDAVESGDLEICGWSIEHGVDINAKDGSGKVVLFYAAESGHLEIVKLLIKYEADIDASGNLFDAVKSGNVEMIEWLFKHGIDNARDTSGKTALFYAERSTNLEVVEWLIEHEADIEATGHRANFESKNTSGKIILHDAVKSRKFKVAAWLINHGADIEARDKSGKTVLFYATEAENLELTKLLIRRGADLQARDNYGRTVLNFAAWREKWAMVKFLVGRNADIEAEDNAGDRTVHHAAWVPDWEMVKWLVKQGANPEAKDRLGKTLSERADLFSSPEMASWLAAEMEKLMDSSVSTSLEERQHEFGDITVQYPTHVFQTLEQHENSIWTILDQLPSLNVDCRVGYDYSCSWYTYLSEDDKNFFTGGREILWVETSEQDFDHESIVSLVERIADVIQPFPVAAINVTTDTIISVNDLRYVATPGGSQPRRHDRSRGSQSRSFAPPTPYVAPATPARPATYRHARESLSLSPREHPPNQGNLAMNAMSTHDTSSMRHQCNPTPPSPPDVDSTTTFPKFIGILRVEDAQQSQTVKISYGLGVSSSAPNTYATTTTIIYQPEIGLPISNRDQQSPSLQCTHLTLAIGIPQDIKDTQCQLNHYEPKINDWLLKISNARQSGFGVTGTLGMSPTLGGSLTRNNTSTLDWIGLAKFINFEEARVSEVVNSKERIWRYPFNKNCSGEVSFPMNHVSGVQYRTQNPVDVIAVDATKLSIGVY